MKIALAQAREMQIELIGDLAEIRSLLKLAADTSDGCDSSEHVQSDV